MLKKYFPSEHVWHISLCILRTVQPIALKMYPLMWFIHFCKSIDRYQPCVLFSLCNLNSQSLVLIFYFFASCDTDPSW